jgi:hypothetical protein
MRPLNERIALLSSPDQHDTIALLTNNRLLEAF